MAINMDKMRGKLAKLRGQNDGGSGQWKPKEGSQEIRIVPTEDGDPLKEMWFHYNLGENRGFLCPKRNFGDRCAVCDFASNLWREGVENNDLESKKLAKSLFVRQRVFSPVIWTMQSAQVFFLTTSQMLATCLSAQRPNRWKRCLTASFPMMIVPKRNLARTFTFPVPRLAALTRPLKNS